MNKFFAFLLILLSVSSIAIGQDKRAEVFLGYSNLQADRSFDSLGNLSNFQDSFKRNGIHGGEAAVTGFLAPWFGLTGDFSYHQKSDNTSFAGGTSQYERRVMYFMAGPSIKIRNPTRVEPFVRGLIGGAHMRDKYTFATTTITGTTQTTIEPSVTKLALGVGGGLDVRLGDKFSLRLIQVDYTPVFTGDRVFNVNNSTIRLDKNRLDNLRISVGLVF